MKGGTGWFIVILLALATVLGMQVSILTRGGAAPSGKDSSHDRLRDYAATLKSNQLYAESAAAYDDYVFGSTLPEAEKAKIDFNTGSMLLDQGGDPQGALARFLRVTDLYEGVDAEVLKEARKLAAECLEKLGRSGSAEQKLVESTRLVSSAGEEAEETREESDVLARIGSRIAITRAEFEDEWGRIPQQVRDARFPGEKGREQFLQELLAMRLYAEAAKRKGLDRDPDVQRRLRTMEEGVLSSLLIEKEVSDRVEAPESDLRLFFEAHKDHYRTPGTVEAAHVLVADVSQAAAARAAIESGSSFAQVAAEFSLDERTKAQGGRLGTIREAIPPLESSAGFDPADVVVPGIGKAPALSRALFSGAKIGAVTGPITSHLGLHLVLVENRIPSQSKSFDESRLEVERDLRAMREEELRRELLAELMRTHEVKIYAARLAQ